MHTILLIEDELHVADLIKQSLEEEGYIVIHTINGLEGLDYIKKQNIDLVVLDVLLPQHNGFEICKLIRHEGFDQLPVLILTALASAENIVLGLDTGADDYLSKPFKLIELKARIRNLLRRREYLMDKTYNKSDIYKFEDLELNDYTKTVKHNNQEISLTSTEYRLLFEFIKTPQRVLNRTNLLDTVWGINFDNGTNVVDVYVNYLRKKLEKAGTRKLIHTVTGMGYVLK